MSTTSPSSPFQHIDTIIVRLLPAAYAEESFADAFFCTCVSCSSIRASGSSAPQQRVPTFAPGRVAGKNSAESDLPTTVVHFDPSTPPPPPPSSDPNLEPSCQPTTTTTKRNALLMAQLEAIHDHCLPVAYDDNFYSWMQRGDNHVTLLAMQRVHHAAQQQEGEVVAEKKKKQRQQEPEVGTGEFEADLVNMKLRLNNLIHKKKVDERQEEEQEEEEEDDVDVGEIRRHRFTKPFFPPATGMQMVQHDYQSPTGSSTKHDHLISPYSSSALDPIRDSPCSHGFVQIRGLVVNRIVPPPKPEPLVAHLLAGRSSVTPPRSREALGALVYIATLGVRDDSRGRGLATELVQRSLEESSGLVPTLERPARQRNLFRCNRVFLHCLDTNFAALRLYTNIGFEVTDTLSAYYFINGEWRDAVVLTRPILAAAPSPVAATGISPIDIEDDEKEDDALRQRAQRLDARRQQQQQQQCSGVARPSFSSGAAAAAAASGSNHPPQQRQQQQQQGDWGEFVRAGLLLAPAAIAGAILLL